MAAIAPVPTNHCAVLMRDFDGISPASVEYDVDAKNRAAHFDRFRYARVARLDVRRHKRRIRAEFTG